MENWVHVLYFISPCEGQQFLMLMDSTFYVLNYKELNDSYLILRMMTWEFGI